MPQPSFRLLLPGLLAVVVLALPHLPAPLTGDQALYLVGARHLLDGHTLYVDFWCIKQPGVYLFYAASAALFGADELGVHLGELLWLLALCVVAGRLCLRHLDAPRLAALAPLSIGGAYYLAVGPWQLTQIEMLPALPACVLLALLLPEPSPPASRWRPFAAGCCGGAVALFVGSQAPVPFVVAAVAACYRPDPIATLARFVAGFGCFWLLVLAAFHDRGALDALLHNLLVYPRIVVPDPEHPLGLRRLTRARWFLACFAGWLALAAPALRDLRAARTHPLTVTTFAWCAATLTVLVVETRSVWPFHWLLFVVPVGILAVRGLDVVLGLRAVASLPRVRRIAVAATAVLLAAVVSGPRWPSQAAAFLRALERPADGRWFEYRCELSPEYRAADAATRFLDDPQAAAGPIYVFGSPVLQLLSERKQALRWHGWGWEVYTDEQWSELPGAMQQLRPPYVFVAAEYESLLQQRAPRALRILADHYDPWPAPGLGTWHHLRVR